MTESGAVATTMSGDREGVGFLFRFIHAADIHLDSPLRGLERYEGAPIDAIKGAPRQAFIRLVDFVIEEEVDFVLLAGDLYDGDWKDYQTGRFFVDQMQRLNVAGIPVHLIAGNHDAASQITKELALPLNVTFYPNKKATTVEIEELAVAIHGQSFRTRSVTDDLAADYPAGEGGRFNIGLLHTSLTGRAPHGNYAPTSVATLHSKGYDYWALGHVHAYEEVSRDPWIVFPGNLQGRHARELGAKGAVIVEVDAGEVQSVEHHAFDVVRWERIEVDLTDVADGLEARDRIEAELARAAEDADRLLVVRLVLTGATPSHSELHRDRDRWIEEFRGAASAVSGEGVFVEKIVFETRPIRELANELARDDALGELLRLIADLESGSADPEAVGDESWMAPLRALSKRLPTEMKQGDAEFFDPADFDALRELLPDVRELLLSRLLEGADRS